MRSNNPQPSLAQVATASLALFAISSASDVIAAERAKTVDGGNIAAVVGTEVTMSRICESGKTANSLSKLKNRLAQAITRSSRAIDACTPEIEVEVSGQINIISVDAKPLNPEDIKCAGNKTLKDLQGSLRRNVIQYRKISKELNNCPRK